MRLNSQLISLAKRVWRLIPATARAWFWRHEPDFYLARSARSAPAGAPIVIAGLFRSATGIGASARSTYRALKAAGLNPIAVDITETSLAADIESDVPLSPMPQTRHGTLLLQLNAPEARHALRALGLFRGSAWRIIGYWAWELEVFPAGWSRTFHHFNEIWCVSDFVTDAIRAHPAAPRVRSVPLPIAPLAFGNEEATDRNAFPYRRKDNLFTVLTMADGLSSFERKNPIGAIRAFLKAFDNDPDCRLIVKTRNIDLHPTFRDALQAAIGDAKNVDVFDASLSSDDYWRLMSTIDVFLSLHRAEGFGMPIAEAMSVGAPAVATRYSGNLMFMDDENGQLVKSEPTPVSDPFKVYNIKNAFWADPDLEDAAQCLRALYDDPKLRARLAKKSRETIEHHCEVSVCAQGWRQ